MPKKPVKPVDTSSRAMSGLVARFAVQIQLSEKVILDGSGLHFASTVDDPARESHAIDMSGGNLHLRFLNVTPKQQAKLSAFLSKISKAYGLSPLDIHPSQVEPESVLVNITPLLENPAVLAEIVHTMEKRRGIKDIATGAAVTALGIGLLGDGVGRAYPRIVGEDEATRRKDIVKPFLFQETSISDPSDARQIAIGVGEGVVGMGTAQAGLIYTSMNIDQLRDPEDGLQDYSGIIAFRERIRNQLKVARGYERWN